MSAKAKPTLPHITGSQVLSGFLEDNLVTQSKNDAQGAAEETPTKGRNRSKQSCKMAQAADVTPQENHQDGGNHAEDACPRGHHSKHRESRSNRKRVSVAALMLE